MVIGGLWARECDCADRDGAGWRQAGAGAFLGLGEYIGSGWVRRVALVPVDARGQVGQRAVTAQEPM